MTHVAFAAQAVGSDPSRGDIVVGIDGSAVAERALAWACREAKCRHLRVHVVHVWHSPLVATGPTTPAVIGDLRRVVRHHADYVLSTALDQACGAVEMRGSLHQGEPAPLLTAVAADADQLVVGDRGHGRVSRALLGSVGSAVAHRAHVPVTVVRGEWAARRGAVVVGVDGSAASRRALARAAAEADCRGSRLIVVGAWQITSPDLLDEFAGWRLPPQDELHRHAHDRVAAAVHETLPDRDDVEVRCMHASPARALLDAAADADLLVVGSRGLGAFDRLLLGSVANACLHRSPCPIQIVPPSDRGEPDPHDLA